MASSFDIVSLGDYRLMAEALNGVAMIFSSGPISNLMRLAFVIGIIFFGVRAAFFTRWDATPLLAGFIGYMCMFGPKVVVTVTDAYSGVVVPVANVPVGIAAPLGITSHAGRYFASTFEQAFSVITAGNGYLTTGYMNNIETLLKMRAPKLGWSANQGGDQIERTLVNYIKDCVYFDLGLNDGDPTGGEVRISSLANQKDTWTALKTTFVNILTEDYTQSQNGVPTMVSCEVAWNNLDTKIGSSGTWISTYYDTYLQTLVGKSRAGQIASAEDRIKLALESMTLQANDARYFMMNTLLGTVLANADSAYNASQGTVAGTIMVTQAAQQRNARWMAEKSMFEQVSRPITAFIELFMIGAAPIMAFAIGAFGHMGFSILGKFMLMHVWVTLWVPTSALVNAYLAHTLIKYVEFTQFDKGVELLSLGGLDSLNQELQTQYATGGMLAAAVPTLTLMLIYGSSQVATQLAQQMRGSEHLDAKVAAPSIQQPAAIQALTSTQTANPAMGTVHNTGSAVGTVALGSGLDQAASSSRDRARSNAVTASLGVNEMFGFSQASNDKLSYNQDGTLTGSGSVSQGYASVHNSALQAAHQRGITGQSAQALALAATEAATTRVNGGASVDASLGTGGGGGGGAGSPAKLGAGVKAGVGVDKAWAEQISSSLGVNQADASSVAQTASEQASKEDSLRTAHEQRRSGSESRGAGKDYTQSNSMSKTAAVSRAISQSVAESEASREALSAKNSLGVSANMTPAQFAAAGQLASGGRWNEKVDGLWQAFSAAHPKEAAAALDSARNSPVMTQNQRMVGRDAQGLSHQEGLERAVAMLSVPHLAPGAIAELGSVGGVSTTGVNRVGDPSKLATSVNTSQVSPGNFINSGSNILLEHNDTKDIASSGVSSMRQQASRWENQRQAMFSPEAIQQWADSKKAGVDLSDDDKKKVVMGMHQEMKGMSGKEVQGFITRLQEMSTTDAKQKIEQYKQAHGKVNSKNAEESIPYLPTGSDGTSFTTGAQ